MTRLLAALRGALERLGARPVGVPEAVIAAVAVWALRDLLEAVLYGSGALLPVGSVAIGVPNAYSHYPLFWLATFCATALNLSLWSRRRPVEVMRVLLRFFPIILLPVLLDTLVFDAREPLGYPASAGTFWTDLAHWFDFAHRIDGISPGLRIELVAIAVMAAGYGAAFAPRTRAPWVGLAAAATQAGIVLGFGYWAGFLRDLLANSDWALRIAATTPLSPQEAVFRGSALVGFSPKVHSLAYLVLLAGLGLALAARSGQLPALVSNLRLSRLAHYLALFVAGLGTAALFHPALPRLDHPVDLAVPWLTGAGVGAAFLAQVWWNDAWDNPSDLLSEPARPVAAGRVEPAQARLIAGVLAGWSLAVAVNVGQGPFVLLLTFHLVGAVYSAPPLRLKRWPGLSHLVLGFEALLVFWVGAAVFLQLDVPRFVPADVSLAVLLCVALGAPFKDLKDEAGDRADGVHTLPVLLGRSIARPITGLLFGAACLAAPLIMVLDVPLPATVVLCGLLGWWMTEPKRQGAGMLLYVAWLACLAGALVDQAGLPGW